MNTNGLIKVDGYYVHPTAEVGVGAQVGKGTRIFHHAQVMPGAKVGERCTIGRSSCIHDGVVIGDGCNIQNYITIPEGVILDDNVFCPAHTVFTNVHNPRAAISRKHEYRRTNVGHDVSFGANCTIICGVRIGVYAMIGAGAVVTKNVEPHALVVGVPARQVGWVTRTGVVFKEKDITGSYFSQSMKRECPAFSCKEEPGVTYFFDEEGRLFVAEPKRHPVAESEPCYPPTGYIPEEAEQTAREEIVETGSIFHAGRSRSPEETYDEIDKQLDELDEGGPNGPVAQEQRARVPRDPLLANGPDVSLILSKHDPGEEKQPTPVYSRIWDPYDDIIVRRGESRALPVVDPHWMKDAIIYAGRARAAKAGEKFWKDSFKELKEKCEAATAAPAKPVDQAFEDMVTELTPAAPRTPQQFAAVANELDAIKLGTAEEERSRAKLWMSDAARYCRDATFWRTKYQAICEEMSAPLSYAVSAKQQAFPTVLVTPGNKRLTDEEQEELETRVFDIVEGLR